MENKEPYKEDFMISYSRRKRNHDYYNPCIYHIILRKLPVIENFGQITGEANIPPDKPDAPKIKKAL